MTVNEKQICPACGELYATNVLWTFRDPITDMYVVLCPDCCTEYEFLNQRRLSPDTVTTLQYVELYNWIQTTRTICESRRPGGPDGVEVK